MGRPGIVLYFDMLGPIRVLDDSEKGRLLVAMLEYGQSGAEPEFEGMLALAWGFVKPGIDRDEEAYRQSVLRRQYGTVCRERKKKGESEISFEEWMQMTEKKKHDSSQQRINDNESYPTTTTASASTSTAMTSSTAISAAAAASCAAAIESAVKSMGGALGRNKVFLSDTQVESLLEQMELETFDYYVDKLAAFIEKNGARVKNHYETILKWYREDGRR